jgi:hypothetical protein
MAPRSSELNRCVLPLPRAVIAPADRRLKLKAASVIIA